jgi:hypothetical protein
MHPSILAQRKAKATNRILVAAEALVKQLALAPALVAGLQPQGVKDPQALEMIRLEGLADLLDQLALHDGPSPDRAPVTAVTAPESDSLPPPVLEPEIETFALATDDLQEDKPRKKPARKSSKKK